MLSYRSAPHHSAFIVTGLGISDFKLNKKGWSVWPLQRRSKIQVVKSENPLSLGCDLESADQNKVRIHVDASVASLDRMETTKACIRNGRVGKTINMITDYAIVNYATAILKRVLFQVALGYTANSMMADSYSMRTAIVKLFNDQCAEYRIELVIDSLNVSCPEISELAAMKKRLQKVYENEIVESEYIIKMHEDAVIQRAKSIKLDIENKKTDQELQSELKSIENDTKISNARIDFIKAENELEKTKDMSRVCKAQVSEEVNEIEVAIKQALSDMEQSNRGRAVEEIMNAFDHDSELAFCYLMVDKRNTGKDFTDLVKTILKSSEEKECNVDIPDLEKFKSMLDRLQYKVRSADSADTPKVEPVLI